MYYSLVAHYRELTHTYSGTSGDSSVDVMLSQVADVDEIEDVPTARSQV